MAKIKGVSSTVTAPLRIYLLVDNSGSMGDENKMSYVKQFLHTIPEILTNNDNVILSIDTFDDRVKQVFQPDLCSNPSYHQIVETIQPAGGTNISEALDYVHKRIMAEDKQLYDIMNNQSQSSLHRIRLPIVILFTDGIPYSGIKDEGAIRKWVDFKQEERCYPIYTFGVGKDHDAAYLKSISKASQGGVYHYIENQQNISVMMSGCIGGLVSTVATDVKLTIDICRGAKCNEIYQTLKSGQIHMDDPTTFVAPGEVRGKVLKGAVDIGSIFADEEKNFVFDFSVGCFDSFAAKLSDVTGYHYGDYNHVLAHINLIYRPIIGGFITAPVTDRVAFVIKRTQTDYINETIQNHDIEEQMIRILWTECMEAVCNNWSTVVSHGTQEIMKSIEDKIEKYYLRTSAIADCKTCSLAMKQIRDKIKNPLCDSKEERTQLIAYISAAANERANNHDDSYKSKQSNTGNVFAFGSKFQTNAQVVAQQKAFSFGSNFVLDSGYKPPTKQTSQPQTQQPDVVYTNVITTYNAVKPMPKS